MRISDWSSDVCSSDLADLSRRAGSGRPCRGAYRGGLGGRMRILFVCHRFPYPPARGGKIRPFNMIRHLARKHEVVVASLARSAEEAAAGRGIADHCADVMMDRVKAAGAWGRMLAGLPTPGPLLMGFFLDPTPP